MNSNSARAAVAILALFCAAGRGAEPPRLPEVVVTATKTEEEAVELPFVVERLEAEDLQQRRLSRTVPEALKELPAVMVQKTAHGQGSPFLRGFTGFRTLMLIDGIRLNNSTFREGPNQYWNTVDLFSIRALELVKGPASVLYGSDAIGGTVNALTQRRENFATGRDAEARLYSRSASAEHSQVGRGEVHGNLGEWFGAFAGFSGKSFGDLRAGDGTGVQPKTGYGELAGDAKLEFFLAPNAKWVAAYQTVRQTDAWRTHRTVFGKSWHGTAVGTDKKLALDQFRDLSYVQYHHTDLGGAVDTLRLSLSYQRQQEREHRIRGNDRSHWQGFNVGTVGLSAQCESPSPIGRWIYGVEHYHDEVDSFRRNFNAAGALESVAVQGPVADDARYDLFGAYVQNLLPVGERWEFILGGRYNYARVEAGRVQHPVTGTSFSLADDWHAAVGSARFLWRADGAGQWRFFGGVSQGFRAPNLSDLTRFDIARSGEQELPAPGLDPEYFTSFEAGMRVDSARWRASAVYFHTLIEDLIDRVPADDPLTPAIEVTKANVGSGFVHGVELSGELSLHRDWTLWGNCTWMEGAVETFFSTAPPVRGRAPLSRVMPPTANVGLRWEHRSQKYWVEFAATFADHQDRLSPGDAADTQRIPPGGTPGYSVFHLRAGWKPSETFRLSLAAENLTDKDYRIHGSGLNEPGRNLILTAELRF